MPGSNGRVIRPTWAEWSVMHWRERQRVRRQLAEHGLEPPEPPQQMSLLLDHKQLKQLDRIARQAQVSRDEYASYIIGRHLARKQPARGRQKEKSA